MRNQASDWNGIAVRSVPSFPLRFPKPGCFPQRYGGCRLWKPFFRTSHRLSSVFRLSVLPLNSLRGIDPIFKVIITAVVTIMASGSSQRRRVQLPQSRPIQAFSPLCLFLTGQGQPHRRTPGAPESQQQS